MNQGKRSQFPFKGPGPSSAGSDPKSLMTTKDVKNVQSVSGKTVKVKKLKTKKERNYAKFHKSEREPGKVCRYPMGRQQTTSSHSDFLRIVPPFALRGTCNSNPIIITQNRLTQRLGMFHREVKSVDIERLVSQDSLKDSAQQSHQGNRSQTDTGHLGVASKPDVTPITELKDQEEVESLICKAPEKTGTTQDSKPNIEQNKEKDKSTPNTDRVGQIQASSIVDTEIPPTESQNTLILEVAEKIFKMLDTRKFFPGRNLVKETKKSIMEKIKQNNQGMMGSDLPGLFIHKEPDESHIAKPDVSADTVWKQTKTSEINNRQMDYGSQGTKDLFKRSIADSSAFRISSIPLLQETQDVCAHSYQVIDLSRQPVMCRPEFNLNRSSQQQMINAKKVSQSYLSPMELLEPELDSRTKLVRNTEAFREAMRQSRVCSSSVDNFDFTWNYEHKDLLPCTQAGLPYSNSGTFTLEPCKQIRLPYSNSDTFTLEPCTQTGLPFSNSDTITLEPYTHTGLPHSNNDTFTLEPYTQNRLPYSNSDTFTLEPCTQTGLPYSNSDTFTIEPYTQTRLPHINSDTFTLEPYTQTGLPHINSDTFTLKPCTQTGFPLSNSEMFPPKQWKVNTHNPPFIGPLTRIFPEQVSHTDTGFRIGAVDENKNENKNCYDLLTSKWTCDTDKSPCFMIPSASGTRPCGFFPGNLEVRGCFTYEGEAKPLFRPGIHRDPRLKADAVSQHAVFPMIASPSRMNFVNLRPVPATAEHRVTVGNTDKIWSSRGYNEHWAPNPQHTLISPTAEPSGHRSLAFPNGESFRQTLSHRESPDDWVYPRMKLY